MSKNLYYIWCMYLVSIVIYSFNILIVTQNANNMWYRESFLKCLKIFKNLKSKNNKWEYFDVERIWWIIVNTLFNFCFGYFMYFYFYILFCKYYIL